MKYLVKFHFPLRCEVACPRDCEVGQWEPWGPCMPLECPLFGDPPAKGTGCKSNITVRNTGYK